MEADIARLPGSMVVVVQDMSEVGPDVFDVLVFAVFIFGEFARDDATGFEWITDCAISQ